MLAVDTEVLHNNGPFFARGSLLIETQESQLTTEMLTGEKNHYFHSSKMLSERKPC